MKFFRLVGGISTYNQEDTHSRHCSTPPIPSECCSHHIGLHSIKEGRRLWAAHTDGLMTRSLSWKFILSRHGRGTSLWAKRRKHSLKSRLMGSPARPLLMSG